MKVWDRAIFDIHIQQMLNPKRSEVLSESKALTFIITFKGTFTLIPSFVMELAYFALLQFASSMLYTTFG